MNLQPSETDLRVHQSVEIWGTGITLKQYNKDTLELIASNGADKTLIHAIEREIVETMITALQRWLDTGGFYAPESDGLTTAEDLRQMINEVCEKAPVSPEVREQMIRDAVDGN